MYTPDKWVVLEITNKDKKIRKVLASFYGGYLSGDSWKLNSGIESTVETDEYYDFTGYSGSTYRCYKNAEGMSGYTAGVYSHLQKKATENNGSVEIIKMQKE